MGKLNLETANNQIDDNADVIEDSVDTFRVWNVHNKLMKYPLAKIMFRGQFL